jgi:ribosomal protein S18 acetylase RimI-like enzyme
MRFAKLDINRHDLNKVAELIFETEPELFSLLFGKNKQEAISRIIRIVRTGNTSFGYNNIYLALKEGEQILGLTIIYRGDEIDKKTELKHFSETFDLFGLIKLYFFEKIILNRLLTRNLDKKELYISNLCVNKNNRRRGIGFFLLKNIVNQAQLKNCDTIVLDVSKENTIAVELYKKFGFIISKERKSWLWKVTTLKMTKKL